MQNFIQIGLGFRFCACVISRPSAQSDSAIFGGFEKGYSRDACTEFDAKYVQQLLKVKRSKVKVTRSRDVSADKNAVTRQWMVISTSNLAGIISVGVDACGILSRSKGQTNQK